MKIKKFSNKIFVNFVNGVVLILPILVTIWLITFLVKQLNKLILDPLLRAFSPISGEVQHTYLAKGVIFILVIFVIALVGWAARLIFINRIFSFGESIFIRVPVL